MNLDTISPYIRVALDSVIRAPWRLNERVIFDYELLYVKEGEISVTVEDRRYDGRPGDVFLFKPGQRHSISLQGSLLHQPHLHFDLYYRPDSPDVKVSFKPLEAMTPQEKEWLREDVCSDPPFRIPNRIRLTNPAVLENLLFDIIREWELGLPYTQLAVKGKFLQLWTYLLRELYGSANGAEAANVDRLVKAKQYLTLHCHEDVTLDQLADLVNMSRTHFIRSFKAAFGLSPMKYRQLVRMEKAKEMIQFTSVPLTEIAERFGYESIHAFSRAFKEHEGVPPSFYRYRRDAEPEENAAELGNIG